MCAAAEVLGSPLLHAETFSSGKFSDNLQEQRDEVLALQSIFNTKDDEKLKVLSEVNAENEGLYTLLITACPQPSDDLIQVDLALPTGQDECEASAAPVQGLSPPALGQNLQLNRSTSGWHWQGSFAVKYLSPVYLFATLPPTYPSLEPPQFHLCCGWLTSTQLISLSQEMDAMWREASQMPIIFTWVNWLEQNILSHLGITDHLVLQPSTHQSQETEKNQALCAEDIGEVIAYLIRFNQEQTDIEFCKMMQECPVCYSEKPGEHFFRMNDCKHYYCHDCMAEFCEMHVKEGTVEALRCPDRKCNAIIPPYIVQAVMSPEAYLRWEQLLLQKTLDAMTDTVYCPRCTSLVIAEAEEELHLAYCTVCYFSFCTQCERGWHQGRDCMTDEEVIEDIQKRAKPDGTNREVERKFQELLRKFQETQQSKTVIQSKTKKCPACKIPVEKNGGCNKMTCKCGQHFCWVCGQKIEGYGHFTSSSCYLFPGQITQPAQAIVRQPAEGALRIQARLEVNPDLANNRISCPCCKQPNLKGLDNNNHIKCWNCKGSFCFVCKQRIIGNIMAHFKGPCFQHS